MAIIVPQESLQPIQEPRMQPTASPESFGGGAGLAGVNEQFQRIASSTGEIATFEKLRADQTAVEEAQAKMSAAHEDILYNPQTGVLGSKGTDALKAQDAGRKRFEDAAKNVASNLHGPQQVGAFQKWVQGQAANFNKVTMVHVDQQLAEHDKQSLTELVKNQSSLAALGHGDPNIVASAFSTVDDNLDHFAKRNRLDKDAADEMKADVHGQMHSNVVSEMLKQGFSEQADSYFKANAADIEPQYKEKISNAILEGNVRTQSTKAANDIWKQTDGNLTEAFKAVDKIENLNVQEMTRARLRELQRDKIDGQEATQNDFYQSAFKQIQSAEKKGAAINIQTAVDPTTWTGMDAANREKIKKLVLNDTTDAQKYTTFSLMTPEEKKAITPDQLQQDWLPYMAPKDRKGVMSDWTKARSSNIDAQLSHDQNNLIADSAKSLGVGGLDASHDPKKLKGDNAQAYHDFNMTAQDAILNFEKTKLGGARKASAEETQSILDNLMMKRVGQHSFLGLKFGGRDVTALSNATPFDQIPQQDRSDLLDYARKAGIPNPTNEQVEQAYFYANTGDLTRARNILRRK